MTTSLATFAYGDLEQSASGRLEVLAADIRSSQELVRRTTAESVLKMGELVAEAHDLLAGSGRDGLFRPWVQERCGFTPMTAYRLVKAYETFNKHNTVLHFFEPTAMYVLSDESCPEDATKEAIRLAKKGEAITAKKARELKAKHTEHDDPPLGDDEPAPEEDTPEDYEPDDDPTDQTDEPTHSDVIEDWLHDLQHEDRTLTNEVLAAILENITERIRGGHWKP